MKTKAKPAKRTTARKQAWPQNGKKTRSSQDDKWILRIYVAGAATKSLTAFANLKKICEEHLANRYSIEVVDLVEHPELAQLDQIVALPTLIRKLPEPIRRIIGNLSNLDRVLVGMDLKPDNN